MLLALEDELQATRWGPMREERLASSHGRSGLLVAGPELCDASVWAAYADVGSTCRHATAACRCRKSLRSSQENQTGQHWQSSESSKNWIFSQVHHGPVLIVVSLKKQRMPGCQPEPCGIFPGTPSINPRQLHLWSRRMGDAGGREGSKHLNLHGSALVAPASTNTCSHTTGRSSSSQPAAHFATHEVHSDGLTLCTVTGLWRRLLKGWLQS